MHRSDTPPADRSRSPVAPPPLPALRFGGALAALILLAGLVGWGAAQNGPPGGPPALALEPVASGLDQPLALVAPDDGTGRLFVAEKTGRLRVIGPQRGLLDTPMLDLSERVRTRSEQGLLGVALHPEFATNGRVFVSWSDASENPGVGTVAEFRLREGEPNRLEPVPVRILLEVPQPYANHNGGHLAFGPDGHLYAGFGDGGAAGDPLGSGQDPSTLLGTIVRLDVDGPELVPGDNPFVGDPDRRDEIWAYGLRNPWRFAFDRATGDLWIADVGQNRAEEVNVEPAASAGGRNYGWNTMEGTACFSPASGCDTEGLTLPAFEYTHDSGWGRSVTGGTVYRGDALPALRGWYLFGDFASGRVFAARRDAEGGSDDGWTFAEPLASALANLGRRPSVASFGEDAAGELYLIDLGGTVYRIVPR